MYANEWQCETLTHYEAETGLSGVCPLSHKIMIVEDEFLIRLTLSEVLADEGYEVIEAGSADEALIQLDGAMDLAVLLTDIQLPGSMDGRQLAARVRESRPDLPVIFMTGRPDAMGDTPGRARERYVAKPYMPSEICKAVQSMLDE